MDPRSGDTFYTDEVFVNINGKQHYLWGAVDQDGEIVDVCLQVKDGPGAKRFFNRLLHTSGEESGKIVTEKLRSYAVAHREMIPESMHVTDRYPITWAWQSHKQTRVRERGIRRLKAMKQAQRFVKAYASVQNQISLGRYLVRTQYYRDLRAFAFNEWGRAVA